MDLELTRKGQRMLEEDCEAAFTRFDYDGLTHLATLATELGMGFSVDKVYGALSRYVPANWPLLTDSGSVKRRTLGAPEMTLLQILLFYEHLELRGLTQKKVRFITPLTTLAGGSHDRPMQFGSQSMKLLEAYLVDQDVITPESCEVYE